MPTVTEEQKKELNRLLELKKQQEAKQLDAQTQLELDKLNKKYQHYAQAKSDELEADLNNTAPSQSVVVKSRVMEDIIDDYNKQFGNKPGYKKPETKDGMTKFEFESQQQAGDFMLAQAQKNRAFNVYDMQMRLIARSTGDGKLYHPDGTEFKSGDAWKPQPGVSNQNFLGSNQPKRDSNCNDQTSSPSPTR